MQLNPGLFMRPDYKVPVKAAVDYPITQDDVDPDEIGLFGPSLEASLVVDVYEAWHAIWPAALQNARPGPFDTVFTGLEMVSPQLHRQTNHFRWMLGAFKPHEIMEAWRPYNVKDIAAKIRCPLLIYGKPEAEQSNEKVGLSVLDSCKNSPALSLSECSDMGPAGQRLTARSERWPRCRP